MAFFLFKAIELQTQALLPNRLKGASKDNEDICKTIARDENVQIFWSHLAMDMADEPAQELLRDVVKLWGTIRGFSMTSLWMQEYRVASKELLKQKKGLRKELKKNTKVT